MKRNGTYQRRGYKCPDCSGLLVVRTSRAETPLCRLMQLICTDVECGASFGGLFELTHRISPSARPNPEIQLRSVPARGHANDDHAPPVRRGGTRGPEVPRDPANENDPGPPDRAAHHP